MADAFEAERRRIERDLHDGAQQKLVSLTVQLGLARLDLPPESSAVAAVAATHLDGRLSGQVENTAYFAVAEALTNIAKHGGATQASVSARGAAAT